LGALAPDVVFHHPFLLESVQGSEHVRRFWTELEGRVAAVTFTHEFHGDDLVVVAFAASFAQRAFQGLSIARWANDRVVELRTLFRPLPFVGALRDAMRSRLEESLPAALWELPAGIDKTPPPFDPRDAVDAKLPIPTTDDIVFHSPVLHESVSGEDLVKRVIGHASAIYGGRAYGPRLLAGRRAFTQWAGAVAGLPIQAANLSTIDERGRMKDLALFMGPMPTLELFFEQVRPRLETFLGGKYFGR
jgi:hypothetical protein